MLRFYLKHVAGYPNVRLYGRRGRNYVWLKGKSPARRDRRRTGWQVTHWSVHRRLRRCLRLRAQPVPAHRRWSACLAREEVVRSLGEKLQAFSVAAGTSRIPTRDSRFRRAPASSRASRCRLRRVPPRAFIRTFGVALFPAVFLDVKIEDARAEDAHPVLRPAVGHEVSQVEMPSRPTGCRSRPRSARR